MQKIYTVVLGGAGLSKVFITLIFLLRCHLPREASLLVSHCNQSPVQFFFNRDAGLSVQIVWFENVCFKGEKKVFKDKENFRTGLGIDCACSYLAESTRK